MSGVKNIKSLLVVVLCLVIVFSAITSNVSAILTNDEDIEVILNETLSDDKKMATIHMQLLPDNNVNEITKVELPNNEIITGKLNIDYEVSENKEYTFKVYYTEKKEIIDSLETENNQTDEVTDLLKNESIEEKIKEVKYSINSIVIETTSSMKTNAITNENKRELDYFIFNELTQTITGYSADVDAPKDIIIPEKINNIEVLHIGNNAFTGHQLKSVQIDANLENIGESAFTNNPNLESVIMNGNVKKINAYAFGGLSMLKQIVLSEGLTYIGNSVFYGCRSLKSITIPNSVTSIGDTAFSSCSSLASITIPNSVTSIGSSTFYYCSSLVSITIPNSVTSIGYSAFSSCSSLKSITIPDSVTSIGGSAFSECSSLASIAIPNSVTSIGYSAFYNCYSLKSITIPSTITSIENSVFHNCNSLESITIPNSVTSIGYSAFSSCSSLASITIPDSVTSIEKDTFSNCRSLKNITIPDSVINIENSAFSSCTSLESITIPNSVTYIGQEVFSGCSSLENVLIEGNNTISIDSQAFHNDFATDGFYPLVERVITFTDRKKGSVANEPWGDNFATIQYNDSEVAPVNILVEGKYWYNTKNEEIFKYIGNDTNLNIPSKLLYNNKEYQVKRIGDSAFPGCSSLESITIPDSVTSIGYSAFSSCSSLKSITIPDSVTSIDQRTFSDCTSLESITIPNSVTSIEKDTFSNCRSLKNITIPDSVINIENSAFSSCTSLESITIPNSVTYIGQEVFSGCSSLENVIIEGNNTISIDSQAFYNVLANNGYPLVERVITFTDRKKGSVANEPWGDNFATIQYNDSEVAPINILVEGKYWYNTKNEEIFKYIGNDTNLNIPSKLLYNNKEYQVKRIGDYAFSSCSSLESITIPDSVTSIEYSAFSNCTSLKSIEIPNSITSIKKETFSNCRSLKSIIIPDSVIDIEGYTFSSCTSLESITIPNSVTYIGQETFSNCSALKSITIPNGVTSIEGWTFSGCSSLTNITIPNSVTSIDYSAFSGCSLLKSITIPNSIGYMANDAFGNSSLTSIYMNDSRGSKSFHLNQPWGASNTTKVYYAGTFVDFEHRVERNDTDGYDICINAFIAKNGVYIDQIILPDGTIKRIGAQKWNEYKYHVDNEGQYTFSSFDNKGEKRDYIVNVSKADVIYNENNNVDSKEIVESVISGDKYTVKNDYELGMKKEGAILEKYNTRSTGNGKDYLPGDTVQPNSTTKLYAIWKDVTPGTVIYKLRNGDESLGDVSKTEYIGTVGNKIDSGIAETKILSNDAVFIGWYKDGIKIENLEDQIIDRDNNVYEARFILDRNHNNVDDRDEDYTVRFVIRDEDKGKAILNKNIVDIRYGERLVGKSASYYIDDDLAPDVTFNGWYKDGVKVNNLENEVITNDVTYEARFDGEASKYRVSFSIDTLEGTLNETETYVSQVYDRNADISIPKVETVEGKRFMGWYLQGDETKTIVNLETHATKIAAYQALVKDEYTVNLSIRNGDEKLGKIGTSKLKVIDNERINDGDIKLEVNTNVKIDGWYKKSIQTDSWEKVDNITEQPITSHCTYELRLILDLNNDNIDDRLQSFEIKFDSQGGKEQNQTIRKTYGDELGELPKVTRLGYTFMGWFDDKDEGNKIEETMTIPNYNLTFYAQWSPIVYDIVYHLDGGKNNKNNPRTYTIEDNFELFAPTKDNFIFNGWFDVDGNTMTKIDNETETKEIYAKWIYEAKPDEPSSIPKPVEPSKPMNPSKPISPSKPIEPLRPIVPNESLETDLDKKVETGDTMLLSVYTASTLIAICVFIGFKKKKSVK